MYTKDNKNIKEKKKRKKENLLHQQYVKQDKD
jgi:hypothetical protein